MITSKRLHSGTLLWLMCLAYVAGNAAAQEKVAAATPASAADSKPNVIFILADDLGWADTTLYGHTRLYKTPNIERLAKRGMTFTHAYAASPLCSPTRSSILTGLSPARTGITTPNCHLPQVVLEATPGTKAQPGMKAVSPNPPTRLKTSYFTIAEALKEAGYSTGHFGKWHLGSDPYSPLQQGFDVDVPHWPGPGPAGSFVAPWKFPDFDPDTPNQHIEDRMAKEAVAFMTRHRDRPFFLNYWMFSVHAPFDAKKQLIEKYRKQIDPADPQRSPTYAAMVESMDDAVGTLLDAVDKLGIAERTIVVFFSDNGGNMYNEVDGTTPTSNAPLRGGKATVFEGGIRVPCIVSWPGVVKPDTRNDAIVQSNDFYPTFVDALRLEPQPGQRFDGISIMPALKGEPLSPRAIFTYFPHNPSVPDWLPPSVAMHEGDWKLIRIFFGGDNGAHRWKLYNLRDDIGETKDLSASEPERVKAMDAAIDKFLADTKAVVPVPNPAFDPAAYRPENEGKAKPRTTGKPAGPKTASDDDPKLQGWKARACTAIVKDGVVTVTGTGAAPFLGLSAGKFSGASTLKFRVRSAAGGQGKVEWLPTPQATDKAQSVPFKLAADDWQEVSVDIPATGVLGVVRLYLPATKEPVLLDWVELRSGESTRRSDFP